MKNTYAKEYYDSFLKQLPTDYKSARWFSRPEATLDYAQTRKSLLRALEKERYNEVLEIGPGDGVWTDLIIPKSMNITLLDQSVEMLQRAKERLHENENINFELADFLAFQTTKTFDLIFAIRCFEYFEDKAAAVRKFSSLLKSRGTLIIVTKNPKHVRMGRVHERELHTGQIDREEMLELLKQNGFTVDSVFSATWRFKAKYQVMRLLFAAVHSLHVKTNGAFKIPFLTKPLTESYLYVATKN